ncbi:MAG: hypothetical protein LC772_11445, partial [Chloroflexi bacterium]|nr:hypothetical protein [Chloroflexota bacterium]
SMAGAGQTQYCFQAMEAATDDLGRAAAERERFCGAAAWMPLVMPWSELQSIHARVFSTWETARTADDTSAIRRLTMGGLVQQAEESAAAKPANRAWTSRHVFGWLAP